MKPSGSSKSSLGQSRAGRIARSSHFAVMPHDIDAKAADGPRRHLLVFLPNTLRPMRARSAPARDVSVPGFRT